LGRVLFAEQDAREADFSTGTVFYFYTPFTGSILRAVLDLLRKEATTRRIKVCAFGPCAGDVAGEAWLGPWNPGLSSDKDERMGRKVEIGRMMVLASRS
jgi:hypothetical protein